MPRPLGSGDQRRATGADGGNQKADEPEKIGNGADRSPGVGGVVGEMVGEIRIVQTDQHVQNLLNPDGSREGEQLPDQQAVGFARLNQIARFGDGGDIGHGRWSS